MTHPEIRVYGTRWCGDCHRARRLLDRSKIAYEWIDIDRDREAEQFVRQHNNGNRSVPTILFDDGSALVEPSNAELAGKLGLKYP